MNIKPLYLNVVAILAGIVAAVFATAYEALAILPHWEKLSAHPAALVISWTAVTMLLTVMFFAQILLVRTLLLTAVAVYFRGVYAFSWLPSMRASHAYSEWSFERQGLAYMGLRIGRLQIVLLGTPLPYPVAAAV